MFNIKKYYAHSNGTSNKNEWQSLEDHLLGVATLAYKFGDKFKYGNISYNIGLFHDLGKAQPNMIKRLLGEDIKVIHSTAGARKIKDIKLYNDEALKIAETIITGHHGGLRNYGSSRDIDKPTVQGFLKKNKNLSIDDNNIFAFLEKYIKKENIIIPDFYSPVASYLLLKMIYSCIVDADFLDTEAYMNPQERNKIYSWEECMEKLNNKLSMFKADTKINVARNDILNEVRLKAKNNRGFYTFTAPPGAGKTLTSIAFAIDHIVNNNMDGVIYCAPYISLVTQNSEEYKDVFGENNILECHSNVSRTKNNKSESEEITTLHKLASENFDFPFIATTFYQICETFFSHNASNNRKLHNIVNKVIIIDEAHLLPYNSLPAIMNIFLELVTHYNCTVLLCSATPSYYEKIFKLSSSLKNDKEKYEKEQNFKIVELISNPATTLDLFRRNNIKFIGEIDFEYFKSIKDESIIIEANTRKTAKKIYDALHGENKYHLSTLMCRKHINETINIIKKLNYQTKLVGTSMMEVGMDFDFKKGMAQNRGLPSLIQMSGRKNRNGKNPIDNFEVFVIKDENIPRQIEKEANITNRLFRQFDDVNSLEAIEEYYNNLYKIDSDHLRDVFDIYPFCENEEYRDLGENYRVFENHSISIIISCYDTDSENLSKKLEQLSKSTECINIGYLKYIRKSLQEYVVNVYPNEFDSLYKKGFIDTIIIEEQEYHILNNSLAYNNKTGIVLDDISDDSMII